MIIDMDVKIELTLESFMEVQRQTAVNGEPDPTRKQLRRRSIHAEGAVCLTEARVLVGMMPGLGEHEHRSARQFTNIQLWFKSRSFYFLLESIEWLSRNSADQPGLGISRHAT